MCEHCEPPYREVVREWDSGLGDMDSASYGVCMEFDEPMLRVYAYDSLDRASAIGHVPARRAWNTRNATESSRAR